MQPPHLGNHWFSSSQDIHYFLHSAGTAAPCATLKKWVVKANQAAYRNWLFYFNLPKKSVFKTAEVGSLPFKSILFTTEPVQFKVCLQCFHFITSSTRFLLSNGIKLAHFWGVQTLMTPIRAELMVKMQIILLTWVLVSETFLLLLTQSLAPHIPYFLPPWLLDHSPSAPPIHPQGLSGKQKFN